MTKCGRIKESYGEVVNINSYSLNTGQQLSFSFSGYLVVVVDETEVNNIVLVYNKTVREWPLFLGTACLFICEISSFVHAVAHQKALLLIT